MHFALNLDQFSAILRRHQMGLRPGRLGSNSRDDYWSGLSVMHKNVSRGWENRKQSKRKEVGFCKWQGYDAWRNLARNLIASRESVNNDIIFSSFISEHAA